MLLVIVFIWYAIKMIKEYVVFQMVVFKFYFEVVIYVVRFTQFESRLFSMWKVQILWLKLVKVAVISKYVISFMQTKLDQAKSIMVLAILFIYENSPTMSPVTCLLSTKRPHHSNSF